jgi:vitamin B12 transporter
MIKLYPHLGAGSALLVSTVIWLSPVAAQQPPDAGSAQLPTGPSPIMQETVVTATGRPEPVTNIAGTIQIIDGDKIEKSTAKSVTDLLAESAVGFMSQWTAGQTSLNIRGGATEGQGRDFKSEVLILINGHRAGTANISKLSIADVERIEIVRGPSSVVYGSQNMGGVVNIILKTGRTASGNLIEGETGSWGLAEGKLQSGGIYNNLDWYVGVNGGTQGNYQVGGGQPESNTAWNRLGVDGAFGWQIDADNRVDATVRSDGVYATGFRGSSANTLAFDNRYNDSLDFTYAGKTPDSRGNIMFQGYYVQDVDDLNNPTWLSSLTAPASRTYTDNNQRMLNIEGFRLQPRYKFWSSNELLVGIDWERDWITSTRFRQGNPAVTQLSPQDNNETDNVWAFYAEDSQKFFGDRLTVRGGLRQTLGTTTLLATEFAPTLIPGSVNYQATTYSAGATLRITDWLNGRAGISSGFRAPTATELGSNFTTTPIGTTIFGNPAIKPETSQQFEAGATITTKTARLDAVLFQNMINNRIEAVTISSVGGVVVEQYQNDPGALLMQGVEIQGEADVARTLGLDIAPGQTWSAFTSGYYNFTMTDYGAQETGANSSMATRVNQYELSLGTRFAKIDSDMPWNVQLLGVLHGPMWYNTEEALSPIYYPGQVRNVTVYQQATYWVWNTRYEIEPHKGVKVFAAVNNILDTNYSPVFIALDQNPCRANLAAQNGSCGNSMPGRELIVGVQVKF